MMKFRIFLPAACLAISVFGSQTASAALIVSLGTGAATAGGSGTFDVDVTNSGVSAANVAGFNFEIMVTSLNITLNSANESTSPAPYIFSGNSFEGIEFADPVISDGTPFPGPGQTLSASDLTDNGDNVVIPSGGTLGLGHVSFSVAAGTAAGPYAVTLVTQNGATSFSDANGDAVTFTSTDGEILVTGVTDTPEPASWALMLFAVPVVLRWRGRAGSSKASRV